MPATDEQRLISALQAGDERAFEEAFRLYRPRLYATAVHFMGYQDAEAVVCNETLSLEASGQAVPALNAYAAAVAENAADLPAWKGMAKLYDRLQRPDYGLRCWKMVQRLDAADPEALEALRTKD